jgi:hypothetical protein
MWALHARSRPGDGAVIAGLLVRVTEEGRTTARKLVWLGAENEVRETASLPRAGDTLPVEVFHRALAGFDSGLSEAAVAAFVSDTPEKLRTLFTSQGDRDRL